MALTKCAECGREISDRATACPQCGAPVVADTGVSAKQRSETGPLVRAIQGTLVLMAVAITGLLIWPLAKPTLQDAGVVPSARWVVENAGGDDTCTQLGDYCMRTRCVVRNVGEAAGAVTVRAELVAAQGTVATRSTTIRQEPGRTDTVRFEFPEAEISKEYKYRCGRLFP